MNKVMIQLHIPATGKHYDVLLPKSLSVAQAVKLLSSFFIGLMGGAYLPDKDTCLCDKDTGDIYPLNASVQSLHLRNGSKLMLI